MVGHAELVHDPPGEDLRHDRSAVGVQGQAGLGAALAGLDRDRVRDPVGEVSVGGGADVPAVQGMLDQPFPGFLLQLEPEPFRDALFHPPDQDGGGVDAVDAGGLVGGEQRDPAAYYSRGFTLSGRPDGLSSNPAVVPGYVQ